MTPATAKAVTNVSLPGMEPFKSGKVREVYDLGDCLLFVATDRISAFDSILPTGIPGKGHILNQLSAWWFDRTRHIVPNHMITTREERFPALLQNNLSVLRGRSMLVKKAETLPVECVVRGYLIGSGWKEYASTGTVCGLSLRPGYQLADRLDEPLFTPSTKAASGHDENIPFEKVDELVGAKTAAALRTASLALYSHAFNYALERGIIIADTKFEFGLVDGQLTLIDEALTPDSSRFWPVESYAPGASPPSFDKQFVRDYLEKVAWDKEPPAPALPDEIVNKTSDKYVQAFRVLTGEEPAL